MKTHPRDSPTGGTPRARARDGGLARSGPFGGRPGPRAGLGARMELGLQWLEAWGFWRWGWLLSAVQNWCPSWVPGRVQLPWEPGGGSGLPPPCRGCSNTPCHRALAVREWPPGTLMGRPSPCGSVLQPGSSSVTSQSHHWEPSATRAKSQSTEGTSAGSMEPRMRDLQIKPEPLSEASGCLPLTPTPTATKATDAGTARSRAGHPVPSPGPLPVSSLGVVGLTRKVC